jgi:hypothetical protein
MSKAVGDGKNRYLPIMASMTDQSTNQVGLIFFNPVFDTRVLTRTIEKIMLMIPTLNAEATPTFSQGEIWSVQTSFRGMIMTVSVLELTVLVVR